MIVGESDATNCIGSDRVLYVHTGTMRQTFSLVTLFSALFNRVLVAAHWIVQSFCECLEACMKGCTSLVQGKSKSYPFEASSR